MASRDISADSAIINSGGYLTTVGDACREAGALSAGLRFGDAAPILAPMSALLVYRICTVAQWTAAQAAGEVGANADDTRDGFIHLSGADQITETVRRHYQGVGDLVVLEIDAAALGDALRWEASRGGELFPHLYGPLPVSAVRAARPHPGSA